MAPRGRSLRKRGLPPNLYLRRGYYSWRNPRTREEFGLGRDRSSAIHQAVEANLHLTKLDPKQPRLLDRITGTADRSVAAWAAIYAKKLEGQELAENTRRTYASHGRRVVELLGAATPLKSITALEVSAALKTLTDAGKVRSAQAVRHFMRDWFREAIVEGWRQPGDNPVIDTKLAVRVEVKRSRLSFEVLQAVYARAEGWLRNAVALALVGAQRRQDVAVAKFSDFRDGYWWLEQLSEKATDPHRIQIPTTLRLDVFGMSLAEVLAQCRRTGVLSPYLIHQTEPFGNSPVGSPIHIDTISKRFSEIVESLNLDWSPKTPPTFHELRSLSERLYAAQGGVNTQHLLGHSDASTTAVYHDARGSEWVRVLDERAR